MKQRNGWTYLIIIIAAIAAYGTWGLIQEEYLQKNICPKILGIPACYIVFLCFILVLTSAIFPFKKTNFLFLIPLGILSRLALTGSLGEILGFAECPKTAGGIPMCFISLGFCSSLWFSKWMQGNSFRS